MSIIPEGALHARKNNMNVENITKREFLQQIMRVHSRQRLKEMKLFQ